MIAVAAAAAAAEAAAAAAAVVVIAVIDRAWFEPRLWGSEGWLSGTCMCVQLEKYFIAKTRTGIGWWSKGKFKPQTTF